MTNQTLCATCLLLAAVVGAPALTARSPVASATEVVASARSSWTYDPRTKLYTYTYSVTNAINSPNHIRTFALTPTARLVECLSPPGWGCHRGWMGDSTATAWAVADPGPAPRNWDGLPFVSVVHISPGETQSGFQVVSDREPDSTAQFVAQGFDTIPTGAHSSNPPPINPTIWEEGWRGPAVVPGLRPSERSPSSVIASATSRWTYDPRTKLYTYTYSVTNAKSSPNHIAMVAIRPAARPVRCIAPPGWKCYRGMDGDTTATAWGAVDVGPAPPNWDGQLFIAPVHIEPGETLGGFQVVSEYAPDSTAQFVAQGFDTIPGGAHKPNPPPMNPTIWEQG